MRFEGIHHVTCITGDAPGNVDFYTRVLGLRMVKKTVNQDDPTVYHLFYADEAGSPGADITFFEYPGARRGRAGAGMVHTITFRVASEDALDFWEARLGERGDRDPAQRRAGSASTIPRASGSSSPWSTPTMRRSSRGTPRSRPSTRSRASTACARSPPLPRRAAASSRARSASLRPASTHGRRAEPCAAGATPTIRRPPPAPACPAPGRCTTSRGPRTSTSRTPGSRPCAAPVPIRAASSTGSGSARSTSASRAACCSRSRRWAPASRSTRTPTTSASR